MSGSATTWFHDEAALNIDWEWLASDLEDDEFHLACIQGAEGLSDRVDAALEHSASNRG